MYKKSGFKPICLINPTQAAHFSKQDSYPALHHQKMILENKNLFSFSRLNRLFVGVINDKICFANRSLICGFLLAGFRCILHNMKTF